MKALAIATVVVALVLLYAIVRALDEANESEWRAPAHRGAAGGTP